MKSIWEKDITKPTFEQLRGNVKTDVLIIGGGMCGILCAYMLKHAGVDCILVEADKICSGVTANTTAKITFQHGLIYNKIADKYGLEVAKKYLCSQKDAMEKLKELAGENFETCNSFVYSLQNRALIEKEVDVLNKIGVKAQFCLDTELPFNIAGAVKTENQGKIHPLKLAYSVAKDLKIYEDTRVTELKPGIAVTEKGAITAKKTIVATHFPFINKHGWYFIKMYQHRSYVVALKNAQHFKDMYVDEADDGLSFRNYNNYLLLGGGGHRTGQSGGNWEELMKFANKYYPESEEAGRWATQDCMTLDGIPYIGQYGKNTSDLYVATGFNKWGMASSMVSAMILTDMVLGKENQYADIYAPSRSILHPQLAINILESAKGLITPTVPRCPHLGCALKYNKQEHSWDCPCHGSRFDSMGKLLNNPANNDKKI
ncbi:MAG: FAD-dependent oxidoreductase [Clostridia bacterium]|nr:FAD-dependent oxidoreductase [Clostridia bacterium]